MAKKKHNADLSEDAALTVASQMKHPRPLGSLVAAAQRLTSRTIAKSSTVSRSKSQPWQADAWDMYDLVGEERFLSTTLANRCGQARFFVGELHEDPTEPPEPTEDPAANAVFDSLASSPSHLAQMVSRLAVNLFVAGDGYLAGIPEELLEGEQPEPADDTGAPGQRIGPVGIEDRLPSLDDLEWRMVSVSEIKFDRSGEVSIQISDGRTEQLVCSPDDLFLIRVWRPHPRQWWQADSPTRASLPVLRELVGLTMHISAQIDSRLAGAGVFIVPQSAVEAIRRDSDIRPEDDADPFTDALIEAMTTPISDRSNASAVVPLVLTVPDESAEKFRHLTFASPLDPEAREMRDEAIRRLALGQDAPPEILLGVGGMNHWGAWLVREDTITTHIEPPLALICDALTSQFLWPVLIDGGMAEERAHRYVIWYDVDHLIMRPNRAQDALSLHQEGVLSDKALRDAAGFSESDAPPGEQNLDPPIQLAIDMVSRAPSLAATPGLLTLIAELRRALSGDTAADQPLPPAAAPAPEDGPPPTAPTPPGGTPTRERPGSEEPPPDQVAAGSGPVWSLEVDGHPVDPALLELLHAEVNRTR